MIFAPDRKIHLTCKVTNGVERVFGYVPHGDEFSIEYHLEKMKFHNVSETCIQHMKIASKYLKPGEWLEVEAVVAP